MKSGSLAQLLRKVEVELECNASHSAALDGDLCELVGSECGIVSLLGYDPVGSGRQDDLEMPAALRAVCHGLHPLQMNGASTIR